MSFNSGHIGNSTWNPTAIMLNLFYDSEKYVSLRIVTLCWSIHFVSAESWDQFNNLQKSHYDWFSAEKWVTPYCRHIMCSKKVIRSYNHSLINLLFYLFEIICNLCSVQDRLSFYALLLCVFTYDDTIVPL
jgi:hypothetical protein